VSDGINIRFGKGPFDKLRDRDFCTVSELVELAVKFRDRGSFGTVSELVELAVKLSDQGSFATVSELVELAVKFMAEPKYFCISLRCKT
jgi:hypothetical protein